MGSYHEDDKVSGYIPGTPTVAMPLYIQLHCEEQTNLITCVYPNFAVFMQPQCEDGLGKLDLAYSARLHRQQ